MGRTNYGASIKNRLKRLGHTQKDLAEALYFTPSYISKIVSGAQSSPGVKCAIEDQLSIWEKEKKEARYAE